MVCSRLEWPKPIGPRNTVAPASVHRARLQDDRFIEREMLKLVVLAEEDAEQDGVTGKLHSSFPIWLFTG